MVDACTHHSTPGRRRHSPAPGRGDPGPRPVNTGCILGDRERRARHVSATHARCGGARIDAAAAAAGALGSPAPEARGRAAAGGSPATPALGARARARHAASARPASDAGARAARGRAAVGARLTLPSAARPRPAPRAAPARRARPAAAPLRSVRTARPPTMNEGGNMNRVSSTKINKIVNDEINQTILIQIKSCTRRCDVSRSSVLQARGRPWGRAAVALTSLAG